MKKLKLRRLRGRVAYFSFFSSYLAIFFLLPSPVSIPPPVVVLQDTFSYLGKSVKCLENTESPLWFSSPVLMMELRLDEVLETVTNTTRQSLECAR